MRLTNRDGTETFYQEFGEPAPEAMVLLHGLGADHKMWQSQIREFADKGYFGLAPDMLGHGHSSKVKKLTLQDWENQINDLLQAKNVACAILVGVSMGGVIAQSFAVNNPKKVTRLILSDTFGELKTLPEKGPALAQLAGFYLYKLFGIKLLARSMASTYQAPFAQTAQEYFSEVSLKADLDQLILARKAINKIDVLDQLKSLDIPALIMVGDQFGEWFIKINRKIATALQGSKFVILKEAMDPSNLVNPVDFNQEVLIFLEERAEQ
jgi:pimeloyl-ACP methyl ester carboxylesterase